MDNIDLEVVDWLRSHDLLELKETFARHKITNMRRVKNLTDDLVKEIVPEVGLRADLSEPLALLKRAVTESSVSIVIDSAQSTHALDLDCENAVIVDEEGNPIVPVDLTPKVKRRKTDVLPKHILSYQSIQALQSLDLRKILNDDLLTSHALLSFEESGGLTDAERSLIVAVAVKVLLKHNHKPGGEEYLCMAQMICDIFSCECPGTYYVPGEPGKNATGKLPHKVKNLKYSLSSKGDVSFKSSLSLPNTKKPVSAAAVLEGCSDPEDEYVKESILTLKHHSLDSWPEILKHWSVTHPARREHPDQRDTLHEVLKAPNGHLLVCQDFKELFPGRENCLISVWEKYRAPLISLIRKELAKNDVTSQLLLKSLESTKTEKQDALIFALLPVLCCKRGRGNSNSSAPPIPIIRKSFFLHVKVSGDLNRELSNHQKSLQLRGLQFQPTILAVGPSLENVNSWYVQIEDVRYHMRTAVAALDVCFKSFFTHEVKFSPDSYAVWLFIQKFFFNMNMEDDMNIPRVTGLISSLKGYVSKCG